MSTNAPTGKEGIADQLAHDAHYIGTDGVGATHYWSRYEQTAYVVEGSTVEAWPLAETPLRTLGDWMDHVRNKRGEWNDHCVTSGGLASLIVDSNSTAGV